MSRATTLVMRSRLSITMMTAIWMSWSVLRSTTMGLRLTRVISTFFTVRWFSDLGCESNCGERFDRESVWCGERLFWICFASGRYHGDGNPDLIVGVPYADQYGGNQGLALIYDDIQDNAIADAMIPATISAYGTTLSGYGLGLGDANNDGRLDVLIRYASHSEDAYGSGRIDLFHAKSDGAVVFTGVDAIYYPTSSLDGTYNSYDDYFGFGVCSGDVNGDGNDDLIVGAPYDDSKWADDGMVYIYHSQSSKYVNKPDVKIDAGGYRPTNRLYGSGCVVMDYNRDGHNDLLIEAQGDDFGGGGWRSRVRSFRNWRWSHSGA